MSKKNCDCWSETNKKLKPRGLKLKESIRLIRMPEFEAVTVFPLETLEGKKPARGEAQSLEISYCPFCGIEVRP